MKRVLITTLSVVFVLLLNYGQLRAQATAQISGRVQDTTGAVLPGVEITATHTETGIARTAVTNETGSYVLPNLPLGSYRLEGMLPGFRKYAQSGIVLEVNSSPVVNVVLEVGQVAETIEVQANANLVETRNSGIGEVVENARILDLPLNGRNVVELVALAGAAAPSQQLTGQSRDPFAQGNVSVAGGLNSALNYTLDGADHNNPFQGSYLSMPFPDAMQEFKVETSALTAKQGTKSSGSISLVTKSGTNQFHGDLFEFVRNGIFNARNAFAATRDTLKRNQYGGTIGGPILKNKLFFFGGYQGTRIRADNPQSFAYVPTAAMLAGDFTVFASPACNSGRQFTLAAPFVNNRVDPSKFSAPAVKFASFLPKTSDPCGKAFYLNPFHDDWNNYITRVDYQLTNNHSLFGRWLHETRTLPVGYDLNGNLLASSVNGVDGSNQSVTLGSTYLFGPNVINSFRANWNNFIGGKTEANFSKCNCGMGHLGINAYFPLPDAASFTVSGGGSGTANGGGGGFVVGASSGPTYVTLYGFNDDVSVVRGNHQMAFGVSSATWWVDSFSAANQEYRAMFNGRYYGLPMADFLLGRVSTWRTGSGIEQHNRSRYVNWYAGDTWRFTQRVTLNYGVRWEPYFPQVNLDGTSTHFDEAALRQGIRTNRFDNAPPGLFFDRDPGFPTRTGVHTRWSNVAPRIGVGWDVSGDGRTSVRAAAGIFYDRPSSIYFRNLTTGPPWSIRTQLAGVSLADPWANYPGGDPGPIPFGGSAPKNTPWQLNSIVTALDYNTPNMRVGQYNLSIQRQIGTDWVVSASYIGNATRHLWGTQPINPVLFVPGVGDAKGNCTLSGQVVPYTVKPGEPCSTADTASYAARRRLSLDTSIPKKVSSAFGPVNRVESGGTANYNGLIISAQRRPVKGVSISANYTMSHCITDLYQDIANPQNADEGWNDWTNRRYDRGNCTAGSDSGGGAEDRRHIFNLSGTAASPQFADSKLRLLASGWQVAPILRILSGGAVNVENTTDPGLIYMLHQRPNQILASPYGDGSVKNFLNPAAFAAPSPGTFGNLGRGVIRGPGTWQFDVALSRNFRIKESQRVEFRAEAFNLTNSFRADTGTSPTNTPYLDSNSRSATFGQIIAARDPRIMQFALKYVF
jgi:Carboxypeptidase regulatory-like domain